MEKDTKWMWAKREVMKLKANYQELLEYHIKLDSPELEILHLKEGQIITLKLPAIAGYKVELNAKKYTNGAFIEAKYILYNFKENLVFIRDLLNPDFNQIKQSLDQQISL